MNLETHIKPELWAAIANSYESANYSHAIKDAMSFVTDVLRDKTGLDEDGQDLVGKALGFSPGKPPRLQINKLETETERNIQNGLQQILRGMYLLIRNPRSHQRVDDIQETADTIILFIDYILDYLGKSQQSFTIQDFLLKVSDQYFVQRDEYVAELVGTIPVRKQLDTLIEVYRAKTWNQADQFKLVIHAILKQIDENKIEEFLAVVSEELQIVNRDSDVSLVIKILPSHLWIRLSKMAQLRAENIILKSLETAWYIPRERKTNNSPSTWVSGIAKYFYLKQELKDVLVRKLWSKDFDHQNFVGKYILDMQVLPDIFLEEEDINRCVNAFSSCIEKGNKFIKDTLWWWFKYKKAPELWVQKFSERLKNLTDPEKPEYRLPDGSPFLGKFKEAPNPSDGQEEERSEEEMPEEEIPF